MSNDEYFKKKVAEYAPFIEPAIGDDLERLLLLFAKDIERDTRHQAADMAQELHSNIVNMTHGG